MARPYTLDDSEWGEVKIINGYAVFIGYLMMGVRGLGMLVFTWTTVVLLGGFVSNIRKTDFWCLTGIALVQTAGVFDFILKEKLSDIGRSWWALLLIGFALVQGNEFKMWSRSGRTSKIKRKTPYILVGIQGLVLGIILCPLGVLYMLGLYISAGVSLWRLIENEYGDNGGANQKPALQVLYSLAVAQGVLFAYKTIHAYVARKKVAKFAADGPGMADQDLVAEYLEETLAGCEKDPSFATGRNLVKYGVDLMMEAESNEGFIAGIRVLGGALKDDWPSGGKVLAKHLLTRSDFWSHVFQRLLATVGPRSPYSREIREQAARIVALVARGISLEQFPGVIESLSSVIDPSSSAEEEYKQQQDSQFDQLYQMYIKKKRDTEKKEKFTARTNELQVPIKDYEREELLEKYELDYLMNEIKSPEAGPMQRLVQFLLSWKRRVPESGTLSNAAAGQMPSRERQESSESEGSCGLDGLFEEAVNIIQQLAVDGDNRRIMKNTVIRKFAMPHLRLHRDHDAILEKYWVQLLVDAIRETNSHGRTLEEGQPAAATSSGGVQEEEVGSALGNAINNIKNTILSIFDCLDCPATQKKQGILILLYLSWEMSFIIMGNGRRDWMLAQRRLNWILALISYSSDDDLTPWRFSGITDRHAFSTVIRDLARQKLVVRGQDSGALGARSALGDLTSVLDNYTNNILIRTHAAIILQGVCVGYKPDHGEEVKGILVAVIPKVVNEILIRCGEGRHAHASEEENGIASEDDVLANRISQDSDADNERLLKALVSLSRDGYMKNKHLRPKFQQHASDINSVLFMYRDVDPSKSS